MDFQSKEVTLVYIDHNWIQRQFRLLQSSFFAFFSPPLSQRGSLTLYSSFWNILIIYLLIIWVSTWVPVPSDTFSSFLWIVVAKVTLFRGLFHINATRKVAAMHLMRWQQLFPRYFWASCLLVCSWSIFLSSQLLGGSFYLLEYIFKLHTPHLSSNSFSDYLSFVPNSWDFKLGP